MSDSRGLSVDTGINIPPEVVERLKEQVKEARERERFYAHQATEIERKLQAIETLAPELFDDKSPVHVDLTNKITAPSKSLVEAVVKAVDNAKGEHLEPKEIRKMVHEQGDGSLITNENYLYTAIKRAADQGRIDRKGGSYVWSL